MTTKSKFVKLLCITLVAIAFGNTLHAQNTNFNKIEVADKLQFIVKDSIAKKVIDKLNVLFFQIANDTIDKNNILKENADLTIAVLNGLQGIKSFKNKSGYLNKYQKQLIKYYPISANTYSVSVAIINNTESRETAFLKTIFRLIAKSENGNVKFSIPLQHSTKRWKSKSVGNITYFYNDTIQLARARKFNEKNTIIAEKLNVPVEEFKFYMCENYQEILNLLGYEYQLESATTYKLGYGVEEGYIFSIMNNEDFSHDVFHYYSEKIHKSNNRNWIAEEGIACSWGNAYYADKKGEMIPLNRLVLELKQYLKNTTIELLSLFKNNTKIFNYIDEDLSVRSVISGVICNEIEKQKGIEGIIAIINSGREPNSIDAYLQVVNELLNINENNFNMRVNNLLKKY